MCGNPHDAISPDRFCAHDFFRKIHSLEKDELKKFYMGTVLHAFARYLSEADTLLVHDQLCQVWLRQAPAAGLDFESLDAPLLREYVLLCLNMFRKLQAGSCRNGGEGPGGTHGC